MGLGLDLVKDLRVGLHLEDKSVELSCYLEDEWLGLGFYSEDK
jgi:hypothetical protein